jgi:uncharacterized membrane protein
MSADDRLGVVSFGQNVAVEQAPQTAKFAGFVNQVDGDASNLGEALETALALIPRDSPGRIFVLSDGRWTGRDPATAASLAATRGIAIDYRSLQRSAAGDLAIARIDAPAQVAPGESFLVTAWVQSPVAQTVSFQFARGGQRLAAGPKQLAAGLNRLTFRDRATEAGNQAYTLTVTGSGDDPVPENNVARILVGIGGPKPILHVAEAPRSGLARLLQAGGLPVKVKTPAMCDWGLEELARYSAVILENVPAEKIGTAGMETLAAWVRETGSGLMMTGGRNSYGTGGYYRSPLEPILPVSMELRNEHRKLALAIVVVLDRSGSMAVPVGGGRAKMDLANLGTVQVLDLLGPMDEFGVIAVDTLPHIIADLAQVNNKEKVRSDVLRIQSMGGGIYIDVALDAAARMIQPAKSGTKHIILFADAMDSEQPGNYKELVKKCQDAGITISVIGLGTPTDKDSDLLRDIASRGKGRISFTNNPEELPRLFAQDTFVVARNTFLDEPTPVQATPELAALTGQAYNLTRSIGGYNLCYLRPEARLATVTLDEYRAPVVAAWQAGTGRVVCYTGEADGQYTGAIARWEQVGDYFTSLARWAAGQSGPLPGNLLVTQEVKNGVNVVELHLDPERKGEPFSGLPQVATLRGPPGRPPQVGKTSLRWTGADTLAVELPLQGSETLLATVEVPGQRPVSLPPVCLPYSPEFRPIEGERGLLALEHLGRATGGKERVDLAGVWKDLPHYPRLLSLGHFFVLGALVLLLLEVLERRSGLLSRQGRLVWRTVGEPIVQRRLLPKRVRPAAKPVPAETPGKPAPVALKEKQGNPAAAPVREEAGLVEALRQARQRTRGRME